MVVIRGAYGRGRLAPGTVPVFVLLALCPCALALNPALDVSQYAHTAWKVREGFTKGVINAITQTPDGYLWLGTEFGLVRFDGVRNVSWQPPKGSLLPSNSISKLLAARDGALWIGTSKGLASWKGGKLTRYTELVGQAILALVEDRDGTVWAGGYGIPKGKLCGIQKGSIRCYGDDGSLGNGVHGLYEDTKGNLWAGVVDGLWRWKPGPPKFHSVPGQMDGVPAFSAGDDGALLIATRSGIRRLVDGKTEAYPLAGAMHQFIARRVLRDRDGGLWIGTTDRGLMHLHQGKADVFARSEGLSGDFISSLFEDREGNIWVATQDGLDRFRDVAVPTFSVSQGLSSARIGSVLAAQDGSVWLATSDGLNRWSNGQITTYRGPGGRSQMRAARQPPFREIVGSRLPNRDLASLFQDRRGRIWVSTLGGFGYLENDRFIAVSGIPGGFVNSIAEDTGGNLWIANPNLGFFRLSPGKEVQQIPWTQLRGENPASSSAADSSQGLWLGLSLGGVLYLKDGQVRASYSATDGLGEGQVKALQLDHDGSLWAATEGGLSRLKNGRFATLNGKNGLLCDTVHWVVEDNDHSFWLYTTCGLMRIRRSDLDAWATGPDHRIEATVYDNSDGVRIRAVSTRYSPSVAKSKDGKLWFVQGDGVSVVDPLHLPVNSLPPPVQIEQITADRKTYDPSGGLHLPALIRDLQIDYTALSLVAPEKVRFRFKLEGRDDDWHDVGTRRQAFYSDLAPRNYRFRVIACNNSGLWNEAGASLEFAIDPAYYQTIWFRVTIVAAVLALLGAAYQLRLRQVARQFNMRLEERVNERTRIARDFHDTLLQSFQGVLMKFSAVTYMLSDRPEAREKLEGIIEQARDAITEGRDAVQGLRSSTVVTNDLARSINKLGEELTAGESSTAFSVQVEGATRDLVPLVRDEVYRIAAEALRNAFRHAHARRIEVGIHYDQRRLRLRVRDDGKGMDQQVPNAGSHPGHFGLAGMQERAQLVGGKLAIWSELDSGTEAELTIPASVAYPKSRVEHQSTSSREGAG